MKTLPHLRRTCTSSRLNIRRHHECSAECFVCRPPQTPALILHKYHNLTS